MALTTEQKSSKLFKKMLGLAETLVTRDFFNESKQGRTFILPSQIWTDEDSIPITAPTLSNGQIDGVVQYIEKLELQHIPGSTNYSYYSEQLKDAIPFNFGDGSSYNYNLYKNDGTTVIPFGEANWLLDTEAGVLTFYPEVSNPLPSGVNETDPPRVSFYKYVGDKGLRDGGSGTIIVKDPVILTTTETDILSNYDNDLSGFTTLPSFIDSYDVSTLVNGDRILVKDQVNKIQNGIYEISGTTLIRAEDSDGNPEGEVNISNYVFVYNGTSNKNSSWLLTDTDADDPNHIIPGVDTQIWKLFSESIVYTTDGMAIQLFNTEFRLVLNEDGLGSGLEQSVDGLRVTRELLGTITGITSLETQIISGFTSLESSISNIDMTSIENLIISGDTSLETSILSLETQLSGHTHSKLYTPDGQEVVAYVDAAGVLHIDGDIVQSGTTYETHIEQLYTKKDHIILREDSITPLGEPTTISGLTGLIAENIDGVDKGLLVFDSGGTARTGIWDGTEPIDLNDIQPLATRIENPTDGYYAYWDSINRRLDFKEIEIEGIGVIGDAPYGDYSDGLFTDFNSGTTIGTAIDRFNEILLLLAPTPPSDWDSSTLTLSGTYSARQLTTGTNINNTIIDNSTPTFNVTIPTQGLGDAVNGYLTFDVDSSLQEQYNISGTTNKTSGVIRYTIGDPYDGEQGKAGFWTSFLTASAISQTLTPNATLKTANYNHSVSGNLSNSFYLDDPLSTSISGISCTIPSMTSYISGVPTLTTSDQITNLSFTINNVSSYFYATSYVWEAQQNLISSKTGDPDTIPSTYGETGSVTSETLSIRSGVFSDTSFSFSIRSRNSKLVNSTSETYTDTARRVDTVSNETIRRTSGTGSYPSTGWGGTYDSTESLLLNQELQLLNGRYVYPTNDYTTQGGPDYSSISSGVRWVTFTTLGTFSNNSSFTLTFNGSQNITDREQSGLYVEVKISGSTDWVDGNSAYVAGTDPGSSGDGDPAMVYGSSSATARRITFGSITYSGPIIIRIGINYGSTISFTSVSVSDLV